MKAIELFKMKRMYANKIKNSMYMVKPQLNQTGKERQRKESSWSAVC